jgi:hypothetical protein
MRTTHKTSNMYVSKLVNLSDTILGIHVPADFEPQTDNTNYTTRTYVY